MAIVLFKAMIESSKIQRVASKQAQGEDDTRQKIMSALTPSSQVQLYCDFVCISKCDFQLRVRSPG